MIKYSGIGALLLVVLVVVATVHGVDRFGGKGSGHTAAVDLAASLSARVAITEAQRQRLQHAGATLEQVRNLPASVSLTADLIAVPPHSFVASVQRPEVVRTSVARSHVVTMVFIAGQQRYAVVDGRFCTQGTRLAQGDQVRRIRPGAVLVAMDGIDRWFYVHGVGTEEQASVPSPGQDLHGV